jgi:hypothetical protein
MRVTSEFADREGSVLTRTGDISGLKCLKTNCMMATAIKTQLTDIVLMVAELTGKPNTSRPTIEVKLFVMTNTRISIALVMFCGANMESFRQRYL